MAEFPNSVMISPHKTWHAVLAYHAFRTILKERGLTMNGLMRRVQVDARHWSDIMCGVLCTGPRKREIMEEIARVLGVEPRKIFAFYPGRRPPSCDFDPQNIWHRTTVAPYQARQAALGYWDFCSALKRKKMTELELAQELGFPRYQFREIFAGVNCEHPRKQIIMRQIAQFLELDAEKVFAFCDRWFDPDKAKQT